MRLIGQFIGFGLFLIVRRCVCIAVFDVSHNT